MFVKQSTVTHPKWHPNKSSKQFKTLCFGSFVEPHWSGEACAPKNGPAQVDAQELPKASAQNIHVCMFFAIRVLRDALDSRSQRVTRFENQQNGTGFIRISNTLTGAMLDLPKEHPKSKNERHAAWERSGTKRNECHAARECVFIL